MLKYLATAVLATLAIAPVALAQSPTPNETVAQIQSIDPQTETLVVKTSDGSIRTVRYLKDSVDVSKLQVGDTVIVGYKKAVPGTVVDQVKNFVYVRPDYSEDGPSRIVVVPQPVNRFNVGDRVSLLSKDRLELISDESLYLSNGDVIKYVRYEVPALAFSERRAVAIVSTLPRRQVEVVQPQPTVVEQPDATPAAQPVRALW